MCLGSSVQTPKPHSNRVQLILSVYQLIFSYLRKHGNNAALGDMESVNSVYPLRIGQVWRILGM